MRNVETAKDVLRAVIPAIGPTRSCDCPDLLRNAVITSPKRFPPTTRKKLGLFLDKYFPRDRRRRPRHG
jgi:hypothetical protein